MLVYDIVHKIGNEESQGLYQYKAMILDSVHGFIPINAGEYWILQTPFMRRLHNIKQLGANYLVFPSAKHTRLEHSLGSMHIASRMANKILNYALSEHNSKLCAALFTTCNEKAYNSFIQVARLAGLLHDLGHLAFSHMIESGIKNLLTYSNEDNKISEAVSAKLRNILSMLAEKGGKVHEFYTYYFIDQLSKMAEKTEFSLLDVSIRAAAVSLFDENNKDVLDELNLTSEAARIIKSIISNEIVDADRLDYLQRDALTSGIVYGNIDIDRLIYGIKLAMDGEKTYITLDMKSMPTLEDIFDARYKMYKSVYFHHKSIAISKSVEKFVNGLADEWDNVKLDLYKDIDLADFLNPIILSNAIANDYYYFDDNEIDVIIKASAIKGSTQIKRWALSLLNRRELLPISVFKRPEQVMIIASQILEKLGKKSSGENIRKLVKGIDRDRINDFVRKKLNIDSAKVDYYDEEIISEDKIMKISNIFNWKESMYIRSLVQIGSIPVFLVYVYSDDENDHINLRNKINEIRKSVSEEISNVFEERAKDVD
jgi:HD superfamily phosphohydrolase